MVEQVRESEIKYGDSRDEKVETNRIEEILVSNSSLVSGLSEASRARISLVKVSQKGRQNQTNNDNRVR